MLIDGLEVCDWCNGAIRKHDGTPIHLTIGSKQYVYHYHNRTASDCLKQAIEHLRKMFGQQTAAPQN